MKRLVVCCDGTWNKPDAQTVTNIEKIARTVQTDPEATKRVQQLVYYVSGVGASTYRADKVLGGAFGFGLFHNVIAAYRFLAQNYEPDDEIFIFGFSRGAYTARSLAGMVAKVGLLTRVSLVEERLPAAVHRYQQKNLPSGGFGDSVDEFKHDHCHAAKVKFLGVFDTVGALGVPGLARAPRFHDVQLNDGVLTARQALAIDETRLKFAPSFWEAPKQKPGLPSPVVEDPRVKQVWFEGAHSDVGGGYPDTGLSDTTLLWMAREAHEAGLVFDVPLLSHYVMSGSDPIRHNPLNAMYRVDNLILRSKLALKKDQTFERGLRRLTRERALSVRIASSAVNHFRELGYQPKNVHALFSGRPGGFEGIVETVTPLPESGFDLTFLGIPPVRHRQPKAPVPEQAGPGAGSATAPATASPPAEAKK